MTRVAPGISAVLTVPLREELVLDLVAVLDGLVGGNFEILIAGRDARTLEAVQARYPALPLRATSLDLAATISRTERDLVLLTAGTGELDIYALNHFLEAIESGNDLAIGYRPWTLERLAWSAFGHLLFGKTARDVDCPFKLFRRSVWQRTSMEPHGVDRWFSTRLVVRARRLGFRVAELPVRTAMPSLARAIANTVEMTG
jgi:hypothetical protein